MLETAGAEVTTISSPLTALERIADVNPHVLVVDLGMPEMDGFELITRIRQSQEPGDSQHSRRRADGVRAIGRSNEGAAQRLRDASREARRSRRAGRIGRDAGAARQNRALNRRGYFAASFFAAVPDITYAPPAKSICAFVLPSSAGTSETTVGTWLP